MVSIFILGGNTTTGINNTTPRNSTKGTELMEILNTSMCYFPTGNLFFENE